MLRWLRWQLAKRDLANPTVKLVSGRVFVTVRTHRVPLERLKPNQEGSQRYASLPDDAGVGLPAYGRFLVAASKHYREPVKSVLNLACGNGMLTRRLSRWVEQVVGLDIRDEMIRVAQSRPAEGSVRFLRGDFRDFNLGETFDAAVCGGESLNCVETPGEVEKVFRSVHRHLRPGGLFVFEVVDHEGMCVLSGRMVSMAVGPERLEVYYFYDSQGGVGEVRVVFPLEAAVAASRRVPLEEADVRTAADQAGLEVIEHFHASRWAYSFVRQFYVLRRRQEGA
jgi:SAM-dependent methyltransferase